MHNRALYPGTFDPVTNGHLDVIRRGARVFSELIVGVAEESGKAPLFTLEERTAMIRPLVRSLRNVRVEPFSGMVVEEARRRGANVLLRGIRTVSDLDYEFQMALTNRTFDPGIETVFVMASEKYSFLSSRLIKEVAALRGSVRAFVPPPVERLLRKKLTAKSRGT